jgi:hypothetical protein
MLYGPTPQVTLPPGGSAAPVTTSVGTLQMAFGPAVFFRSGAATVTTQGTPGPTGSVTSSTSFGPTAGTSQTPCFSTHLASFTANSPVVTSATANFTTPADLGKEVYSGFLPPNNPHPNSEQKATIVSVQSPTQATLSVNATGTGSGYLSIYRSVGVCIYNSAFSADTASTTCTSNQAGTTASTHFTNGFLVTETDDYQDPTVVVAIPDNPAPNTTIDGYFWLNGASQEVFTYVFNEQIHNPDGSLTVIAAHLTPRGPTAYGDAYFGVATCGATVAPPAARPADFDGNGSTDVSVFRPSTGQWLVNGQSTVFYGVSGDIPVPCNYGGGAAAKKAIFRPSVGGWYINGQAPVFFGLSGDIPVPGDYNGDGTCDIAVFRPSVGGWYINGQSTVFYGLSGDIPVPGDYDGNGTTDVAIFRPSVGGWYINGQPTVFYGLSGDIPVPGDYDGNGTTDVAIFRPSVGGWYRNGAPTTFFGLSGDVPVPGDYDGNGTTDVAVFRPSTGQWFVTGAPTVFFGTSTDIALPLPAAIRMAAFP